MLVHFILKMEEDKECMILGEDYQIIKEYIVLKGILMTGKKNSAVKSTSMIIDLKTERKVGNDVRD